MGPIWLIGMSVILNFMLSYKINRVIFLINGVLLFLMLKTPLYDICIFYDYSDAIRNKLPYAYSFAYGVAVTSSFFETIIKNKLSLTKERYAKNLEKDVAAKTKHIKEMQNSIIYSFAEIIESRDNTTGYHIKRSKEYVKLIVNLLKEEEIYQDILTKEYIDAVCMGAPLHDIGKIAISDSILLKGDKLTEAEFEIMKLHTIKGQDLISNSLINFEDELSFLVTKQMITYHHEQWDGNGYPFKIKGEKIPLCARIMAIADIFDSLVSKRPYKEPFELEEAINIIKDYGGNHLDPIIVNVFVKNSNKIKDLYFKMKEYYSGSSLSL